MLKFFKYIGKNIFNDEEMCSFRIKSKPGAFPIFNLCTTEVFVWPAQPDHHKPTVLNAAFVRKMLAKDMKVIGLFDFNYIFKLLKFQTGTNW